MSRHAVLVLLLLVGTWPAHADDFTAFLARFRAAMSARDAQATADLTQLPFMYEGRMLDRAAFVRAVPALFDARVASCLARAEVRREGGDRTLHCAPYTFYLRPGGDGRWRLAEFAADGEDMP